MNHRISIAGNEIEVGDVLADSSQRVLSVNVSHSGVWLEVTSGFGTDFLSLSAYKLVDVYRHASEVLV